uniref:G protein-coupled receptor n=1 Tax=Pristionchus pacificus TaxID=54126 RepID=A0A8R1V101_PRIPA
MALISPPSPIARAILRRIRFVLTPLSIASAIFTIFIILSCKDASGKKYSRLILASVVLSFLFEMYLQLVLDPVFLFPTPCLLRDEPIFCIPGRASIHNVARSKIIFVMLVEIDTPLIMTCFIHRHQAVMPPGSRWSFSTRTQLLPQLVLAPIYIMIPMLLFRYTEPSGSVHKYAEMFSDNWPGEAIASADCFYPKMCAAICIWAAISCALAILFFIVKTPVSDCFSHLFEPSQARGHKREVAGVSPNDDSSSCDADTIVTTFFAEFQSLVPLVFVILPYSISALVFFVDMSHPRMLEVIGMSLIIPLSVTERAIIRRIRFALTPLSFLTAIFTTSIILSCKDASGRLYLRLILASVMLSLIFEMYLQLVLDPVYLFPVPCMFRDEPILDIYGRATIHNIIFILLTELDAPVIVSCFIHRHQAVMAPGSRWSFSTRAQLLPALFIVPINIMMPMSYTQPPGSIYQYAELLSDRWPAGSIARADCFDPNAFSGLCIWALISSVVSIFFFIVIVSHTFSSLQKHTTISGKMREFHRTMTRVLVLQTLVPLLFVVLPCAVAALVFFLEMNHPLILPICITIMSAHSFAHSVVVIFTTPPYRRQILSVLIQRRFIRMRTVGHTFATLHKHAAMSEKMRNYHRTMTIVLVLQSGVPAIFIMLPYCIVLCVFFLESDHPCTNRGRRSGLFQVIYHHHYRLRPLACTLIGRRRNNVRLSKTGTKNIHFSDVMQGRFWSKIFSTNSCVSGKRANRLINQNISQIIYFILILCELPVTLASAIHRHQAVITPGSRWSISARAQIFPPLIITLIVMALYTPILLYILSTEWPSEVIARADCFSPILFANLCVTSYICILITSMFFVLFTHPCVLSGTQSPPLVFNNKTMATGILSVIIPIATTIISAHSFVQSFVVLRTTPTYRTHTLKIFTGLRPPRLTFRVNDDRRQILSFFVVRDVQILLDSLHLEQCSSGIRVQSHNNCERNYLSKGQVDLELTVHNRFRNTGKHLFISHTLSPVKDSYSNTQYNQNSIVAAIGLYLVMSSQTFTLLSFMFLFRFAKVRSPTLLGHLSNRLIILKMALAVSVSSLFFYSLPAFFFRPDATSIDLVADFVRLTYNQGRDFAFEMSIACYWFFLAFFLIIINRVGWASLPLFSTLSHTSLPNRFFRA